MSCNYQSSIVTSGLVLCLDTVDRKSYTGTGTVWADRSGNRNNATLVNGPTFSTDNSGTLVFDGTDDYADFFAAGLGTTTTVEMWAKIGAGYTNKMFFGWNVYSFTGVSGNVGFNTGNGDIYGITSATVTGLGLVNNWKHYVCVMRSDVTYTNNKLYVNTSPQTLTQVLATENATNRNFNSGLGRVASWRTNNSYPMPMSCSTFRVYNRELTPVEIQRNFNAARGRYNL
jgi:hypothetical protein